MDLLTIAAGDIDRRFTRHDAQLPVGFDQHLDIALRRTQFDVHHLGKLMNLLRQLHDQRFDLRLINAATGAGDQLTQDTGALVAEQFDQQVGLSQRLTKRRQLGTFRL